MQNKYYYFITSDSMNDNKEVVKSAYDIAVSRLNLKKWPVYRDTILRTQFIDGDEVVFYLAGKEKYSQHFIARATISGGLETVELHYDLDILETDKRIVSGYISFKKVNIFNEPVSLKNIINELDFIKNKNNYGLYFQGGIRHIDKKNFNLILASDT